MMTAITRLLAGLFTGATGQTELILTATVALAAMLIRFFAATLSSKMSFLSSKTVKKTLREKIYSKLLRLGASYKEQVMTSEVVQVAVAFLLSILMCLFIGSFHWAFGVLALVAYLTVGIVIPLVISKASGDTGMQFRTKSGDLSAFVLDSLNEAVILKSLREEQEERTVVLVSHRKSTMRIADKVYSVEHGRVS